MKLRFVLLPIALAGIGFGCATPEQPQVAAAGASPAAATTVSNAAPTQSRSSRMALTGTRLPPLDDDDVGSSAVSAATGDDYRYNDATRVKILCGENPAGCSSTTGAKLR